MSDEPQVGLDTLNVAKPAAIDLLTDPLTDLTRRRQAMLLIAGTVTLLLSYAVITPGASSTVVGITLQLSKPSVVPALSGLITAYFLILYLLGVYADWSVRRVRLWTPFAVFDEIRSNIAMEEARRTRIIHSHLEALADSYDPKNPLLEEQNRAIRALEEQMEALLDRAERERNLALSKEAIEIGKQILRQRAEDREKRQEANRQRYAMLQSLPSDRDTKNTRFTRDEIQAAFSRERHITLVRLAVEVAAPSLLGLTAVIRTLVVLPMGWR